jgi:monoamine oxidase
MQGVAERLAVGLDVRLGCPVRAIEHDAAGVTVAHDGGSLCAARAIISIPPGLIGAIRFTPALTGARAALIAGMPMGAVIKCTAIYARPFWRDAGLSGLVLSDQGPIHVSFDNSPPAAERGIIMGFAEADEARRLGKLTLAARREAAVACFVRAYGPAAADLVDYADHVWEHDEWSGGCYGAFAPPGLWTSAGPAIREPVGAIHWAGTETATRWSGYIDGALSSGLRAAAEVEAALSRPGA